MSHHLPCYHCDLSPHLSLVFAVSSSLGSLPLPLTPHTGGSCLNKSQVVWLPCSDSPVFPSHAEVLAEPTRPHLIRLLPLPALNSCHSPWLTLLQPPGLPLVSDVVTAIPPGECTCHPPLGDIPPNVWLDHFSLTTFRFLVKRQPHRSLLTSQAKIASVTPWPLATWF